MIYVYVIPSSDVTQPKIVPVPGADEGDYIPEIW